MEIIILAAGKGVRFWPLTTSKPKPLVKILNKTILEHNLDQLIGIAKEAILVVGYKSEMVKQKIGLNYKGIKIKYIFQKKQLGTGDAAVSAKPLIKNNFLLLNGDDLYFKEDIKNVLKKFPSIGLKKVLNPQNFGVILEKNGKIIDFCEKPKNPKSNSVSAGIYFLPRAILKDKLKKSERGEYEFTDFVKNFIKKEKLNAVTVKKWIPQSFSWDLFEAANHFLKEKEQERSGKIEKGAQIKGKAIIKKGAVIRSGSYIIGPVYIGKNCLIGPNCFIRENVLIGDNCRIGQAVEIKNSIIQDNTNIAHLSYVGDSIISENSNLGAGTIIANVRHDKKTIKTMIGKELIDTGRKKFGTIMGDGVKTGVGTMIYPGRKIEAGRFTLPGQKIKKDIL